MNTSAAIAIFMASVASYAFAAVPTVGKVTFSQDPGSRIVTVSYTLKGADAIITTDIRTNGVSIGAGNVRRLWGDVNRIISADDSAVRTFSWAAGHDWPGNLIDDASLSVEVIAHPKSDPPRYMAICLGAPDAPKYFYDSADALPEGITASRWKTEWLLMRKIDAAGVTWRKGAPGYETETYIGIYNKDTQSCLRTHETPRMVTLTNDYYIGVYPVTQRQYFLARSQLAPEAPSGSYQSSASPSVWRGRADSDMRPVENIQWHTLRGDGGLSSEGEDADAKPYNWPNAGHTVNEDYFLGKMRARFGVEFDLPTEAQWEYACRAGCGGASYDLSADIDELAWTTNNSAVVENGVEVWQTHPVGLKKPNAFGLYDMLGNVQEWVLDLTRKQAVVNADGEPDVEPAGAEKMADSLGYRIRKGGSYQDVYARCAPFCSPLYSQNANSGFIGFRLCAPAEVD